MHIELSDGMPTIDGLDDDILRALSDASARKRKHWAARLRIACASSGEAEPHSNVDIRWSTADLRPWRGS